MKYIDYAERLETFKRLVELKQAGTPRQLAKKLNVSERTILRMVQQLKEHQFPITFNRFRNTYEKDAKEI